MILRAFLSVIGFSAVLVAQQIGHAQTNYAEEFDDSWRLIGEDKRELRARGCRRYRGDYPPASRTSADDNDESRFSAEPPYKVVTRTTEPSRYTTRSTSYPVSKARPVTQYPATTPVARPTYTAPPPSYRAPAPYSPSAPYSPPASYGSPTYGARSPVQYRSTVPAQVPIANSNPVTWPRYDGARSYPVASAGYRPVPTASSKYYYGTSIYGEPMIYAKNQPIRNWLRSLMP